MPPAKKSLIDLFGPDICIDAVYTGANPIVPDGVPPYQAVLMWGRQSWLGLSQILKALKWLNDKKGPNELYLPYSVFDGSE